LHDTKKIEDAYFQSQSHVLMMHDTWIDDDYEV
jgi:hypothetical protein